MTNKSILDDNDLPNQTKQICLNVFIWRLIRNVTICLFYDPQKKMLFDWLNVLNTCKGFKTSNLLIKIKIKHLLNFLFGQNTTDNGFTGYKNVL